ncbi:CHAT domain-containing protein [Amycolatopsis sp. NPDC003865]
MEPEAGEDDPGAALAVRVGRAVAADVEGDSRRYPDLETLIESCVAEDEVEETADDEPADEDPSGREYRVGLAALIARRVCADPAGLDELPEEERAGKLTAFAHFMAYLGTHRDAHLKPGEAAAYPQVLRRFTDGALLAGALWGITVVLIEELGFEGFAPIAEEIEQELAKLAPEITDAVNRTTRQIERNPAISVGRVLRAEAEIGERRFRSLEELLRKNAKPDLLVEDDEHDDPDYALGTAALNAASLCAEPDMLTRVPSDLRPVLLSSFAVVLRFVVDNKLWYLAPEPLDHYGELVEQFEDVEARARAGVYAASITRERGDVQRSLELLLTLDGMTLEPSLSATIHLHVANTFRDVRRFDESSRRYAQAEEAAEDATEPYRSDLLAEIAHQRDRLSLYSDDPDHRPAPGAHRFDPNPFRPGSVFDDPERWRAAPQRLLTLAQQARSKGDLWTTHKALSELASVVPSTNYELLTWLHHEAAELVQRFGGGRDVVRWHGFLETCAAILGGSRRELGGVLSRQAARLASSTDVLPAFALARWAAAHVDRVSLYTSGINADIGFVAYRNGSLSVSKGRYDASLAAEDTPAVRVQRDLVAALLGDPVGAPVNGAPGTRSDDLDVVQWRSATRLLTGPADDVHTWESLLRFSKGDIGQWSVTLRQVVEGRRAPVDDEMPMMFGNTSVDNAKARVFEQVYTTGLLPTLDRLWHVPPWAGAGWALAGRTTPAMRRQISLEVVVSSPPPPVTVPFASNVPPVDLADVAAKVDRLLAVTFLPEGNADFGGADDAAELRAWAVRFLADHGGHIAFRLVDDQQHDDIGAKVARRTEEFQRRVARLPAHLQLSLGMIEMRKGMAIAAGPVRDIAALEREYVAELGTPDARRLQQLLDSRMRITTDVLPSAAERNRAEVSGWFTRRHQAVVDLVQGTDSAHLITCRRDEVDVTDVAIGRAPAQSVAARVRLAASTEDVVPVADALRVAAGKAAEVSLRLREPWGGVPVENVPGTAGRALSDDIVVVRKHSERPRFGAAGARLPHRRVRVLGDPRGGTPELGLPGALEEARGVADVFGVAPLVQDAATWQALRASATEADLLWVSTHCKPFADLGGTPALLLSDRWVLPSEIAALRVRPGMVVVLTVCAGGLGVSLGAVAGPPLATAFLDAGAALVVSPLRPIRDVDWASPIVAAARRARARRGSALDLVRMLNEAAPDREHGGSWVMHA